MESPNQIPKYDKINSSSHKIENTVNKEANKKVYMVRSNKFNHETKTRKIYYVGIKLQEKSNYLSTFKLTIYLFSLTKQKTPLSHLTYKKYINWCNSNLIKIALSSSKLYSKPIRILAI